MNKPKDWVFSDPRLQKLEQDYAAYKKEDFEVWSILFERQIVNLPKAASKAYLEGIKEINFTADKIADFEDVNRRLAKYHRLANPSGSGFD
jgi:phenylalanine-4-hydroxylase